MPDPAAAARIRDQAQQLQQPTAVSGPNRRSHDLAAGDDNTAGMTDWAGTGAP